MGRGTENFVCGPLVPEDVRQAVGWQFSRYDDFIFTVNSLRSLAHVLGFDVRPLYLECGCELDETGQELARRLIMRMHDSVTPAEEVPERRKFFMRLVGRDPDEHRYPLTFPTQLEASHGGASKLWAVSTSDGAEVVSAGENLLKFAGPRAERFVELLRQESPKFARPDILGVIVTSLTSPSGYLAKLLLVARAASEHNTHLLSWWSN